jgi:putative aldouronate transport system permease protein
MKLGGSKISVVANVVLCLLALSCIFPLLLLVISSFTAETELARNGYSFFPGKFGLDAYEYLWNTRVQLLTAYKMSFIVTALGVCGNLTITTLFAYGLSKKEMPGHTLLSFMVFFTMLFSGGIIPSYLMWVQVFHIKDTLWALLVPNLLMNGFSVIVMRTYFNTSIPVEVLEAGTLDGAGEWRMLLNIVLPLSSPIIATIALLSGLAYWNDWINGLYYIVKHTELFTIQNFLNRLMASTDFIMNANTNSAIADGIKVPSVGIRMAIAVIAVVPVLCTYPFLQRGFVKGIVIGSVKG